jgi:hypothetical protein
VNSGEKIEFSIATPRPTPHRTDRTSIAGKSVARCIGGEQTNQSASGDDRGGEC